MVAEGRAVAVRCSWKLEAGRPRKRTLRGRPQARSAGNASGEVASAATIRLSRRARARRTGARLSRDSLVMGSLGPLDRRTLVEVVQTVERANRVGVFRCPGCVRRHVGRAAGRPGYLTGGRNTDADAHQDECTEHCRRLRVHDYLLSPREQLIVSEATRHERPFQSRPSAAGPSPRLKSPANRRFPRGKAALRRGGVLQQRSGAAAHRTPPWGRAQDESPVTQVLMFVARRRNNGGGRWRHPDGTGLRRRIVIAAHCALRRVA